MGREIALFGCPVFYFLDMWAVPGCELLLMVPVWTFSYGSLTYRRVAELQGMQPGFLSGPSVQQEQGLGAAQVCSGRWKKEEKAAHPCSGTSSSFGREGC